MIIVATAGIILVAILITGALYESIASARSAERCRAPGVLTDVGGHRLHATCAGEGTPAVVLEAGIAASSLSWTRVAPEIAKFTRVCAYDRAGLGWSELAREPRTLERIVEELRTLVARTAPAGSVVMVGHSFGAYVGCAFATRFPNNLAGLVLVDPPAPIQWARMTRAHQRMLSGGIHLSRIGGLLAHVGVVRLCLAFLTGGAPGVPRRFVKIFGPTAAKTLERLVGEVRKLPPEVWPIVQQHWSGSKCFRGMADHLGALQETATFITQLGSLPDIPVVVISSRGQTGDQLDECRALARLSPQGQHVIAGTSGHWIQFDEPDLVVDVVRQVVDQLRRAAA